MLQFNPLVLIGRLGGLSTVSWLQVWLSAEGAKDFQMFQDVSKNMPRCHLLLIVTVVAIMFIYKDTTLSMMLLRIGIIKLLTYILFIFKGYLM